MQFLIADTFTASLARLTGDEQKAVKTTAFDLQLNPASPGMSFHRLGQAKNKGFWSVRAGSGLRLIVYRTGDSLLLCHVDHHDKAYAWAERPSGPEAICYWSATASRRGDPRDQFRRIEGRIELAVWPAAECRRIHPGEARWRTD